MLFSSAPPAREGGGLPQLHPPPSWPGSGVRRASEWPLAVSAWPTGHAALDLALPGGGWPQGGLVDVLQPDGLHLEWQLLAPALATWLARDDPATAHRRQVWLVQPPHPPGVAALQAVGLPAAALGQVQAPLLADRLWAVEQALGCPDVAAVLAWLPALPMRALRRLAHAAQRHGGLCWLFRPASVQGQPTAAVLQLVLSLPLHPSRGQPAPADPTPAVWTAPQVRVLKRQGPPLARAVALTPRADRLAAVLAGARWRQAQRRRVPLAAPSVAPAVGRPPAVDRSHDALLAQSAVSA